MNNIYFIVQQVRPLLYHVTSAIQVFVAKVRKYIDQHYLLKFHH